MYRITLGLALACLLGAAPQAAVLAKTPAPAASATAQDGLIPLKDFVRRPGYSSIRISPTGEYLAMTVDHGDQDVLTVLRTRDLSLVKVNQLPDKHSVGQFFWTSPNRLMFTSIRKFGRFAAPFGTGRWYSVNADGTQPRVLDPEKQSGRVLPSGSRFAMLHNPQNDDGKILMTLNTPRGSESANTEVVEFDSLNANWRVIARAPRGNCQISVDADMKPAYAVCYDSKDATGKFDTVTSLYKRNGEEWTLVSDGKNSGEVISVIGAARDGEIYAERRNKTGTDSFGIIDRSTGQFVEKFRDPIGDAAGYISATDGSRKILGVVVASGKPEPYFFDIEHKDLDLYRSLENAFPDQVVSFLSSTRDGKQVVFAVYSDRNPGELYLFDREKNQARFMLHSRRWVDPEKSATVKPIVFRSRDGLTIHAYLTIPAGSNGKNLPLIVNVHGGPAGPRDDWGYNWESQMFASRGYAVLQVNYRGSGGFGKEFEDKAYRNWHTGIMNDIVDGTRFVVDKGHADPNRVCIYGGSFGGYASMMAPAMHQGVFKCAFGYVGMYDTEIQMKLSDTSGRESGRAYLERAYGETRDVRAQMSPVHFADKIKIPTYLAAGARDARCPPEHTEAMQKALIAAGNAPEGMIIQSGEGHGFYEEEANLKLYTEMLNFFARHIGGGGADTLAKAN